MGSVTMRQLRNEGGEVVDRVVRGESVTVTRDGTPVAELRPVTAPGLTADELLSRWRHLPVVEPGALRADLDVVLDARV